MPTPDTTRVAPDGHDHDATEPLAIDALASNTDIPALQLEPDTDLSEVVPHLGRIARIYIRFPAFTDGRGFSLARILRREGFTGPIVADGQLIPDQYAFALQCGFDAVRVDDAELARHTPEAWNAALNAFNLTYQRGYVAAHGPSVNIFEARDTALPGTALQAAE